MAQVSRNNPLYLLMAFDDRDHKDHQAIIEECSDEMNRREKTLSNDVLRQMISEGRIYLSNTQGA